MREWKACHGGAPGARLAASVPQIRFAAYLFTGRATLMQRWARQSSCHILFTKLTISGDDGAISISYVCA
jgi:hypothetical protein